MLSILKNYTTYIVIYHFYLKKIKIDKYKKLVCDLRNKKKYVIHNKVIKTSIKSWIKIKKSS